MTSINVIRKTLENPDFVRFGVNPKNGKKEYRVAKKFGEGKYVVVTLDRYGSVTTAYPTTSKDKYEEVWKFGKWVYGYLRP